VIHDYEAAVTGVVFDDRNDTVGGGVNRCAVIRCDVNAGMEGAFAAERIETFAKAIRDVAKYGQTEGVYEESAKPKDGSKRKPPAEMAIAAAFFLRKVYCSTD